MAKEEMLNGHNGDVPPQLVQPVVEELEIGYGSSLLVLPSGLREVHPRRNSQIFIAGPPVPLA